MLGAALAWLSWIYRDPMNTWGMGHIWQFCHWPCTCHTCAVSTAQFYCGYNCIPWPVHGQFNKTAYLGSCTAYFQLCEKMVNSYQFCRAENAPYNCQGMQFCESDHVTAQVWQFYGHWWFTIFSQSWKCAVQLPRYAVLLNCPWTGQGM